MPNDFSDDFWTGSGPTIKDHPASGARWDRVPEYQKTQKPYRYVGLVQYQSSDGTWSPKGTAWLRDTGVFVTCAHVIVRAHPHRVVLPNTSNTVPVQVAVIEAVMPDYLRIPLPMGINDLAALRPTTPLQGGLAVETNARSGPVTLTGYPQKTGWRMRTHTGRGFRSGGYLIHGADASQGHSGGPLIRNGKVVAIEVGAASALDDIDPGRYDPRRHPEHANTGLVITQRHVDFLDEQAALIYG